MDRTREALFELKPVAFRYKKDIDPAGTPQLGLIAEDSVRYDQVNAMLLNEFLKEHQTVQELRSTAVKQDATIPELKSTVAQQQKGIEGLTAGLQKVSAQLEASKAAPQVVSIP